MPDNGIPHYKKIQDVMNQITELGFNLLGAGSAYTAANNLGKVLTDLIFGVATTTDAIKATTDLLGAAIGDVPPDITDAFDELKTKVANIQWFLSSDLGTPDVIGNYPVLDLRPITNGVPTFAPNTGSLYHWLEYLAHTMVPDVATEHRHLGRTAATITYAVPDCWGFEIAVVGTIPGQLFSPQPDAPITEWVARVSLGRGDYYSSEVYCHHPKQFIPLQGFIPTNMALEVRPGVTLDVWAVMPVGFV
jgi:hypothetical protein